MKLHIKTKSEKCNVTVNIKQQNKILLNLTDNDEDSVELEPETKYRFEWLTVTGSRDAHMQILAEMLPAAEDLSRLDINKDYPPGIIDGNIFFFTTIKI